MEITQLRLSRMATNSRGAKSLAEKIGMSYPLLSSVERRAAACPEKWRSTLSDVLGIPADLLFDRWGIAKPASRLPSDSQDGSIEG
jgi:ribosome-binding protein aMBF1 (putative translation factor)